MAGEPLLSRRGDGPPPDAIEALVLVWSRVLIPDVPVAADFAARAAAQIAVFGADPLDCFLAGFLAGFLLVVGAHGRNRTTGRLLGQICCFAPGRMGDIGCPGRPRTCVQLGSYRVS